RPGGSSPRSTSAWISATRRGFRRTWRWWTLVFSTSRPAFTSRSPIASASAPGEPAREMHDLGVVAAPLPHPHQALEHAPGDAQRRVRLLVRARDLRG